MHKCNCGEEFHLIEVYLNHIKQCDGKPKVDDQQMISFPIEAWGKFLAGLRVCLLHQIGDHRRCPKCNHAFIPDDPAQKEAVQAFASIFPDEADSIMTQDTDD